MQKILNPKQNTFCEKYVLQQSTVLKAKPKPIKDFLCLAESLR